MSKNDEDTLATKALLVRVRITLYTARVRDVNASRELEQNKGAEVGIGIYTKTLVSKKQINRMVSTVKAARRQYEEITLPWGKDGTRLLPSEQWGPFHDVIEARRDEFWREVDAFIAGYDEHKRNKKRMGKLYNDKEYLDSDKVRDRFSFDVLYAPVPESGDIRVELSRDQLAKLKREVQSQAKAEVDEAMRDLFYRLYDATNTLYGQLTGDDHVGVRSNTFEHLHRLADILPTLNVGNDPKVNELLKVVRDQILAYDAGQLRDHQGAPVDPQAKKRATAAARRIIEKIKRVDGIDVVSFGDLGALGLDDDG